jgi:hypothetical protein
VGNNLNPKEGKACQKFSDFPLFLIEIKKPWQKKHVSLAQF